MDKNKIGTIFMISVLSLAGIGISYAGLTDTINIYGSVNTATVQFENLEYTGTWVYKVWGLPIPTGTPPEWADFIEYFSPEKEILIFKADKSEIPTELDVQLWAQSHTGNAQLISWAESNPGANSYDVDVEFYNLMPGIEYTADLHFNIGTIPVKVNTLEYDFTAHPLLEELIATGHIYGKMYTDTGKTVELGTQIHPSERVALELYISIPQNNIYQGLNGEFTCTLDIIQWTDQCEEDECFPPLMPIDPTPPHQATDVDFGSSILLGYKTGHDFDEDVYLNTYISTDLDPLNNYLYHGRSGPHQLDGYTQVMGNHVFQTYPSTTYYWQIVVEAECGEITIGPVWMFTTKVDEECEEEITLSKKVWDTTSEEWVNSIDVLTGDIITFNISIYLPEDACSTCNGNVTDRIPYGNNPLGFSYIDGSTEITVVHPDDTIEYLYIEPLKVELPHHVVGLIWDEDNMGAPLVLLPGMYLYFTYDVEVKVSPAQGAFTFTATISATYDCIQEPVIKASDAAQVFVCVKPDFSGEWDAIWDYYGHPGYETQMTLAQDSEGNVAGTYTYDSNIGTIQGIVVGRVLTGTWDENGLSGELEFTLSCDGQSFAGIWFDDGVEQGYWNGVQVPP